MAYIKQDAYAEPSDPDKVRDQPLVIHQRTEAPSARFLAVFVHGMGGSRYGDKATWGDFPKFVFELFPAVDIGMYSYRTLLRRLVFWRSINLKKEAEVLAGLLKSFDQYDGFLLLGHSMGGILCKGAVAHLIQAGDREVAEKIKGLILMATPQLGSTKVVRPLHWFTKDFQALLPHGPYLTEIQETFQNHVQSSLDYPSDNRLHVPSWALVAAADFWVDSLSAGVGFDDKRKRLVSGTHTSVVKPKSVNDDGFRFVRSCIKHALFKQTTPYIQDESWPARAEELQTIYDLGVQFFGEGISALPLVQSWWAVNQTVLTVIRRVTTAPAYRDEKIVGYYCLIPLKSEVIPKVYNGEVTGATIKAEFVIPPDQRFETIYIGSVVGTDFRSRASAMNYLRAHIQFLTQTRALRVFTRPVTGDGLRAARGHGMVPIGSSPDALGSIFEVNLRPTRVPVSDAERRRVQRNARKKAKVVSAGD